VFGRCIKVISVLVLPSDYIALENSLSDVIKRLSRELTTWKLDLNPVSRCCLVDTLSSNGIVQTIVTRGTLRLRTQRLPCELCDYVTTAIRVFGLEQGTYLNLCHRLFEEVAAKWSASGQYSLEKVHLNDVMICLVNSFSCSLEMAMCSKCTRSSAVGWAHTGHKSNGKVRTLLRRLEYHKLFLRCLR